MTSRGSSSSTPLPRCSAPRATHRADRGPRPRPTCWRPRWTGRRCTAWTRSRRPRPWRGAYGEAGCRWRVRVRRWWRSSRSPSSPPRSECRRMRGSGTSATPSSCATGCPRVWRRVQCTVTCGRGWRAGSPSKTLLLSLDAASFVDRHVAPTRAPDRTRPAGPAGRRGDRPLHARRSRGAVASSEADGRYFTVESRQVTPTTAPSPSTASSTSPTRWSWRRAIQTVAAQLKDLGSTETLDVRRVDRGRRARPRVSSPSTSPAVEAGRPRPSRNHQPATVVLYVHLSAGRPPTRHRPVIARSRSRRQPPCDHHRPGPRTGASHRSPTRSTSSNPVRRPSRGPDGTHRRRERTCVPVNDRPGRRHHRATRCPGPHHPYRQHLGRARRLPTCATHTGTPTRHQSSRPRLTLRSRDRRRDRRAPTVASPAEPATPRTGSARGAA